MHRKRENLQSYFAGIFDGEGTVGLYQMGDRQWSLRVAINMTDPRAVGLIWAEYPEGKLYSYEYKNRPNTKPYYKFGIHGTKATTFLKEIEPYVILKHDQVKLGLSFLAHQSRYYSQKRKDGFSRYVSYPDEYYKRTLSIANKMKQAKQFIGVNSVNLLAKHGLREYRATLDEVERDVVTIREHLESVETRLSESNKAISVPEKDIVHV